MFINCRLFPLPKHEIFSFRAYKEALRQQRIQDSSAIYKPKDSNQSTSPDASTPQSTNGSPTSQSSPSLQSTPPNTLSSSQSSPVSPLHSVANAKLHSPALNGNGAAHKNGDSTDAANNSIISNGSSLKSPVRTEKPVQKVIPSRNSTPIKTYQSANVTNGNQPSVGDAKAKEYNGYVKPTSPTKAVTSANGSPAIGTPKATPTGKAGPKINRYAEWFMSALAKWEISHPLQLFSQHRFNHFSSKLAVYLQYSIAYPTN